MNERQSKNKRKQGPSPHSQNGRNQRDQYGKEHMPSHEGQPLLHEVLDDTESEAGRQEACRGMTMTAIMLFGFLFTLRYASSWFFHDTGATTRPPLANKPIDSDDDPNLHCSESIPFCKVPDGKHQVPTGRKANPSFWDYATQGPMNVTYDGRSFSINGDRVLFLSGSVHPIRSTKHTLNHVLDEAVHNGLNMVTIYVFWAEHQRFPGQKMDWTLMAGRGPACQAGTTKPSYCGWSLADAIRAAAMRGLFVHARIGPYVCAEYSYGGIPEWVALHNPNMTMRRLNRDWLDAMEAYVKETIFYLTENKLFAYQGGPIVMAQIENELGEEEDFSGIPVIYDDLNPTTTDAGVEKDKIDRFLRSEQSDNSSIGSSKNFGDDRDVNDDRTMTGKVSVQDYANWCGSLVARLAPKVVWTMCNGLSAENTIITCNGDCSTTWLENHGSSGRIQVDHPAIWSEDEGGFQIWGDEPTHPSDYFWGRTANSMAYDVLRWFARGGTHLNYYMFWGGYNRGRAAAAGIMNGYATDAVLCSSGERHQPKFDHFSALHTAIQHAAPVLLEAPTALNQGIDVEHRNEVGEWDISGKQRMFVYQTNRTRRENREIVFVENESKKSVVVRLEVGITRKEVLIVEMSPQSAMLLKDGAIKFDSSAIYSGAMAYERKLQSEVIDMLGWSSCAEAIGASQDESKTFVRSKPVEQTALNIDNGVSSDFSWYETTFKVNGTLDTASILVETQKGSAMVLLIDGVFQGDAYNRQHAEGNVTLTFPIGSLGQGPHVLAILSESLGYHNLIGRWGASTKAKTKGITGDVILASENGNRSLVDGENRWKSSPGLNGSVKGFCREIVNASKSTLRPHGTNATKYDYLRPHWSMVMFNTPTYDPKLQALFLKITTGRGHQWLNGHNMGRWWNITRGATDSYSQQYYFIPLDYLESNGSVNRLVLFDALGGDLRSSQLVLSWLETSHSSQLLDQVDFFGACI